MEDIRMLTVEVLNLLNDKEFRYKAENKDGFLSFKFGLMEQGNKVIVSITPLEKAIQIQGLGKEKQLDIKGLEAFIDQINRLKVLQEEEKKLWEQLKV